MQNGTESPIKGDWTDDVVYSNLGYLLPALFAPKTLGAALVGMAGMLLCLGSAAYHATYERWAQRLDVAEVVFARPQHLSAEQIISDILVQFERYQAVVQHPATTLYTPGGGPSSPPASSSWRESCGCGSSRTRTRGGIRSGTCWGRDRRWRPSRSCNPSSFIGG